MWWLNNNFLSIVREQLDPDFYPQDINYDNLGKNDELGLVVLSLILFSVAITLKLYLTITNYLQFWTKYMKQN